MTFELISAFLDTLTSLRSNKALHSPLFVDASTQACVAIQSADRDTELCLSHKKSRDPLHCPPLSVAFAKRFKTADHVC